VNAATDKCRRAPVLGIVGGLGSGKSTVARLLAERGAAVVDADRIGHRLLERPELKRALIDAFGDGILDGAGNVCRRALAERAFASAEGVEKLNRITHPPLLAEVRRRVRALGGSQEVPLVVLDAALLVEWGLDRELCDAVLFVEAPSELRRTRASAGRAMSEDDFDRRAAAQLSLERKMQAADYVVHNAGSLRELERQVEGVWEALCGSKARASTGKSSP